MTEDGERSRSTWPVVVVAGLAIVGAVSIVSWILGAVFTLARLALVVVLVAAVVIFFRGPPDGR